MTIRIDATKARDGDGRKMNFRVLLISLAAIGLAALTAAFFIGAL